MSSPFPRLRRSFSGLREILGAVLAAAAVLLGAALVAAAIVLPLWFLATRFRGVYTVAALAAMAVAIGLALFRRLRSRRLLSRPPTKQADRPSPRRRRARAIGMSAVVVILAYVDGILYWRGIVAGAVPVTVALLVLTGYAIYSTRAFKR